MLLHLDETFHASYEVKSSRSSYSHIPCSACVHVIHRSTVLRAVLKCSMEGGKEPVRRFEKVSPILASNHPHAAYGDETTMRKPMLPGTRRVS
jgi:hypothetical protein